MADKQGPLVIYANYTNYILLLSVTIRSGTESDHTIGRNLFALELRLDHIGTVLLMCRVSSDAAV